MPLLALKLTLTPLLIAGATLVARRWGPTVGGWAVSLPWTSGPVALFIGLEHGYSAGASSAAGSVAGCGALLLFCVVYARSARTSGWPISLAMATAVFAIAAVAALEAAAGPLWLLTAAVVALIIAGRRAIPAHALPVRGRVPAPRWELPARMAAGAVIVVVLTEIAQLSGPRVSGVLAMYPVITIVLSVFAHREGGAGVVIAILRGLVTGLAGTAVFLAIVAWLLPGSGPLAALGVAIVATAAVQGVTWRASSQRLAGASGEAT
jgi:hypothetical protein